jgi:hypothetical protein
MVRTQPPEPGDQAARLACQTRSLCRKAAVSQTLRRASACRRGCFTKPSAKTWAPLAVTVAQGPGSAEAGQGPSWASDDLPLFRARP